MNFAKRFVDSFPLAATAQTTPPPLYPSCIPYARIEVKALAFYFTRTHFSNQYVLPGLRQYCLMQNMDVNNCTNRITE